MPEVRDSKGRPERHTERYEFDFPPLSCYSFFFVPVEWRGGRNTLLRMRMRARLIDSLEPPMRAAAEDGVELAENTFCGFTLPPPTERYARPLSGVQSCEHNPRQPMSTHVDQQSPLVPHCPLTSASPLLRFASYFIDVSLLQVYMFLI